MQTRTFAVYRMCAGTDPVTLDITDIREATAVDAKVDRRDWFGVSAESPAAAIEAFRRHEANKSLRKAAPSRQHKLV